MNEIIEKALSIPSVEIPGLKKDRVYSYYFY